MSKRKAETLKAALLAARLSVDGERSAERQGASPFVRGHSPGVINEKDGGTARPLRFIFQGTRTSYVSFAIPSLTLLRSVAATPPPLRYSATVLPWAAISFATRLCRAVQTRAGLSPLIHENLLVDRQLGARRQLDRLGGGLRRGGDLLHRRLRLL